MEYNTTNSSSKHKASRNALATIGKVACTERYINEDKNEIGDVFGNNINCDDNNDLLYHLSRNTDSIGVSIVEDIEDKTPAL